MDSLMFTLSDSPANDPELQQKQLWKLREHGLFSLQHFNIIFNLTPFDVAELQSALKKQTEKDRSYRIVFFVKLKCPRIRNGVCLSLAFVTFST